MEHDPTVQSVWISDSGGEIFVNGDDQMRLEFRQTVQRLTTGDIQRNWEGKGNNCFLGNLGIV